MGSLTISQLAAVGIVVTMLACFVVDRWRYDLVAVSALLVAVVVGIVPAGEAFSGFSDPVVVVIASVLVVGRAIARSGLLDTAVQRLLRGIENPSWQIGILTATVALMSAFVKNVGTLGIFIPIAIQVARRSRQSPSIYLMPLAFGSLIGGTITQIGTSPNLIISSIRQDLGGARFGMFEYAWVGLPLTLLAVAFLTFGWKLLPKDRRGRPSEEDAFDPGDYTIELTVPEGSPFAAKSVGELEDAVEGHLVVTSISRGGTRNRIPNRYWPLHVGDVVTVRADPKFVKRAVEGAGLKLVHAAALQKTPADGADDLATTEAIVTSNSVTVGHTVRSLRLREAHNVNFLGVSRAGRWVETELRSLTFQIGDVLVLQGYEKSLTTAVADLGLLPLADRRLTLAHPGRGAVSLGVLAAAMLMIALDVVSIAVGFVAAAVVVVWLGQITLKDAYAAVDGPIIILLAALIPIAKSLEATGVTQIAGASLANVATVLPGYAAVGLMLAAAMIATPFLNNAAAALMLGPLAGYVAVSLGYNADPFLMAVALGCACDFLTPIGHQNNLLVMGPGGYRFSDYWRLGLPLSLLVLTVGTALIVYVWPLG